jgi:hypothetical protein
MAKYTFKQFQAEYPDDAACLARIMEIQYGGDTTECQVCQRRTKFHPMSKRRAYACRGVCRVAISNAGMSPASACPMGDHARTGTSGYRAGRNNRLRCRLFV